jgi:hypothetical protein
MIINQRKDEHQDFNAIIFALCNDHFWSSKRVGDEDCVKELSSFTIVHLAHLRKPHRFDNRHLARLED